MELSYFVLLLIDESAVCVPVSVQRFSVLTDNKCQCFKMAAQKTRLLIHTFIFLIVTSTFNTDDLNSAVSASEWHTARTWWTRSPSEVLIRGIVVLISSEFYTDDCVCVCVWLLLLWLKLRWFFDSAHIVTSLQEVADSSSAHQNKNIGVFSARGAFRRWQRGTGRHSAVTGASWSGRERRVQRLLCASFIKLAFTLD